MQITERARERVNWISNNFDGVVRLQVDGGGCAGYTYHFDMGQANDDDILVDNIHVDPVSIGFLQNATIDYLTDLMGERLHVAIPDAKSMCGCGTSFSMDQSVDDQEKKA